MKPGKYKGPLASGLNRREFLKTSRALLLLASLPAKQLFAQTPGPGNKHNPSDPLDLTFSETEQRVLDAVQMQLFPDDGDGPCARDLNALTYLQWAMQDPDNIEDGDPEFISKGVGWLTDLSVQDQGKEFPSLTTDQQGEVMQQISKSRTGENWLSLLLYYLTESLMLDPVYGGNPNSIGWTWLGHQPGFPRPIPGKRFMDFEQP
ncbi:MAG: gluconate 2-dehydrogenase subunit 3 family protein [bacterium]|nr:gluconate 2-dehydrogenase subunit 3 family protein [Gammaproteobacteria bacterium]HIL96712.1 gluconate 2-dehydrogenase subunit 3 family protein [Pseudomonadales bacterium]